MTVVAVDVGPVVVAAADVFAVAVLVVRIYSVFYFLLAFSHATIGQCWLLVYYSRYALQLEINLKCINNL